jgi:dethiobiotin synthetase
VKDLFVTGTGTGVGKTVLSALLTAGLDATYWKPIQTGRLRGEAETDREAVLRWTGLEAGRAPRESYVFDPPVSPHLAASMAGVEIDLDAIRKPVLDDGRRLVIEGAGGVLVPINADALMLDLVRRLDAAVVIAALTELGTINHTLLTVEAIRNRNLDLIGVAMIGEENVENRRAIERYGNVPVIGWIPRLEKIDRPGLLEAFRNHFDETSLR